ncbi:hypothetical protein RvY_10673 [Ramazzottius varieornatus]|uniref:Uncharacterized protein n=1 Tax=Ramazzottius varieornatus TaxID=947166 RepID=A0A1D1VFZ2_RAMVA|nr:hypothetical protein RvY_10673 [Ramazzottius varieornatus]
MLPLPCLTVPPATATLPEILQLAPTITWPLLAYSSAARQQEVRYHSYSSGKTTTIQTRGGLPMEIQREHSMAIKSNEDIKHALSDKPCSWRNQGVFLKPHRDYA